ncbi:hypothetical protein PIB30_062694 [Stylosanthes scabra]|uniref:Uncharacterized protein n=1 Tax=Stylosanthes scabra TaxID=79078 RepID=A0ABU6ZJZ8_9FABA|nr:hypothetical protein [Stylosanthes scabra]
MVAKVQPSSGGRLELEEGATDDYRGRRRRNREGNMNKGSLQSKKRSLEANLRKSSTHMHGKGHIFVQAMNHPRLGIPDQA